MPVDPQAQAMLDQLAAAGPIDFAALPPELVRRAFESMAPARDPEPVDRIFDLEVPGGAGHGSLSMFDLIDEGRGALDYAAARLREALA